MTTRKITPYVGDENYIFISYSHKDSQKIHEIIKNLITAGYNIWYDEGIAPGMEWDDEIAAHIENCDSLVAFISNNYLASENCKDELNYARDLEKERLLIYLEDVQLPRGMAMRMNRLQAIHMYSYKDKADFYEKLCNTSMIGRSKAASTTTPGSFSLPPHTPLSVPNLTQPPKAAGNSLDKFLFSSAHIAEERYVLREQIAKGAMATVYRGYDTQEKREVAIKFFDESATNFCPFLSNEELFKTIMDINNPHLSKIYDTGYIKTPYIVTEYIAGKTLREYVDSKWLYSNESLQETLHLFRQILGALNSLHIHNIFYGDLNPYNIMVSNTGQVYLVDYTECNYNGSQCPNKTIMLTEYMSPERGGFGTLDYRSDIYEAGIILEQLTNKAINSQRLNIMQHNSIYDTQIFDIIKKATNYEPDARYQSVLEMLQDIDKLLV